MPGAGGEGGVEPAPVVGDGVPTIMPVRPLGEINVTIAVGFTRPYLCRSAGVASCAARLFI